jgi:hypothetical protein
MALIALAPSLCVHPQSETSRSSIQIDSFGMTPNGDFRSRADLFMQELLNQPDSRALIVVYGSPMQIASRRRLINNHFSYFRKFPLSRMDVRVGGNISPFRTDFWLIPAGAAPPEVKPEAWIEVDFGSVTVAVGKRKIASFFADKKKACSDQVYIINYGSAKQIAQREMWFRKTRISCGYDGPRITLVNGGPGPVRTVMWLVPPGAENPTP